MASQFIPEPILGGPVEPVPFQPKPSIQDLVDQTPVVTPDEFAGFEEVAQDKFGGFQEVSVAPDEFAGFEEADAIDISTPEQLLEDDQFNIVQFVKANPEALQDPVKGPKLLEAYRQQRIQGITSDVVGQSIKAAPAVGAEFVKGARDLTERLIDAGLQPTVNTVLGLFSDPQTRRELTKETKRKQKKAVAEIAAGSETAGFGLANLLRTGKRKLATSDEELRNASPEDLRSDLLEDVSFAEQAEQVATGQGAAAEIAGLDADKLRKEGIELDPEAIAAISTVDPLTLIGTGGALSLVTKAGRVVGTVKTAAQGARVARRLGVPLERGATAAQRLGQKIVATAPGAVEKAVGAGKAVGKAARGIQKFTPVAAGAVPKGIGKATQAVGRGVEKLGQKSTTPLKTLGGVAGAAKGFEMGGLAGGAAGAGLGAGGGAAAARGIQAAGRGIQRVGGATVAFGRKVAGEIPKGKLFRAVNRIATSGPVVGATIGGVAAAPLGLAVDTDEEAAQLIAGGIALGGGAGAGIGAAKKIVGLRERLVGQRLLDPFARDQAPTVRESPDYGIDPNLDAIHREQVKGLDPEGQAVVNEFRELFRGEGEIYLQSPEAYAQRLAEIIELEKGAPLTAQELAATQEYARTHAVFSKAFQTPEGPRKVVFLNKDAQGLTHDAGHLFEALLPEAEQNALRAQIRARYSPQEIQAFKQLYEDALNKNQPEGAPRRELTPEEVYGEILAENFSALFSNVDVTSLGTPRPLADRLIQSVASMAEKAGVDLTGGRGTPNLGVKPSINVQRMMENAVRDRAAKLRGEATPEGTAPEVRFPDPAVEAPGVRNKRVTPEEQAGTAAAAPDSAGIQTARAFAEETGNAVLANVVDDIAAAFERKRGEVTPLEFEVLGAKEAQPGKPTGRRARLEERLKADVEEAAGAAPQDVRDLFQAVQVPVRFEVVGRGKNRRLQLLGMSLDKVMANVGIIAREAGKRDLQSLIPYDVVQTGDKFNFSPEAWRRFQKDLVTYTENQQNGFRGDGRSLTRPEESLGASIPPENPNYNPTVLPEEVGNFINLIQGIAPPQTARVTGAKVPGNIKARTIAELNLRPVEKPAQIAKRNVEKQTFPTGETIGEPNPLRNQLAEEGVPIRDLHEVTERFRVDRIKSVKPRSELQFRAPQTDVVRAGFLPESLERRRVVAAAIKTPDGDIVTGPTHIDAFLKATEEGKIRSDQSFEDGFVDGATEFLTREEAFQRATEIKQAEQSALTKGAALGGQLESQEFARAARFLPEKPRTGLEFKKFFTDVSAGRFGKSEKPFIPEIELPEHTGFIAAKEQHTGNFDNHIQKSIPTFYETQVVKGKSIVDSLPEGGRVLDIAASEGSFGKAISQESSGKVETVSLDPNQQMKKFFQEKSEVDGATYDDRAFLNGFEDEGRTVPAFQSSQKFDVVNETMGFQFIDGDRAPQIAEVKRLLTEDGVFFTEEKLKNPDWAANEKLKDTQFKNKYFDDAALKAKEKRVGFQQSKNEQNAVGMVDNMATQANFEAVLLDNFAHVVQYWDSGNFKGYMASDSRAAIDRFLGNMENLDSKFATVETPRTVDEPSVSFLPEAPADVVAEVARMGAQEFRRAFEGVEGGMTGLAVRLGKKFKSPEQLEILSTLEQAAKDDMRAALQEGRMDDAMILASKPQFFREARESATGTGSVGDLAVADTLNTPREGGGQFLPARDAGTPRTERGKALAKRYTFTKHPRASIDGERMVTFSDPATAEIIGEVTYGVPDADGVGSIKNISVDPGYRRQGIGQTLMREAMSDLQDLGANEVVSDPAIVSANAVRTRESAAPGRTVFRAFSDIEPIPAKDAVQRLVDNRELFDAKTDIRGARFLPEESVRLFHGGPTRVSEFDLSRVGSKGGKALGPGIYASTSRADGEFFAGAEGAVTEVSSALKNPIVVDESFQSPSTVLPMDKVRPLIEEFAGKGVADDVLRPFEEDGLDTVDAWGLLEFGSGDILNHVARGLGYDGIKQIAAGQRFTDLDPQATHYVAFDSAGLLTDPTGQNKRPLFLPKKKKGKAKADEKLPLPMKAFITPDAEFVKVNRSTHDDYLIENSKALNKKYGTKIPAKQGKTDVRVGALNKGFIRVAYEPNNGRLTYEANAKTFDRKQADKIFMHVADNLDSIDNITVSLLDEKGRVKKSASRQLFLMDDDAQKLDSIPYVTDKNPERSERLTPFFLPEQPDAPRTRAGEDLVKNGKFSLKHNLQEEGLSDRLSVEILDNGSSVAEVLGSYEDRDTFHVADVSVSRSHRGQGLSEVLYRELAAELQNRGTTKISGNAINDIPLRVREKVFGDFIEITDALGRDVTPDEAKARTQRNRESGQGGAVRAVNRVDPSVKFLPEQRDLLNVPRAEGAVFTKKQRSEMTQAQLKENFPEAIVPRKGETIPYGITKSPLYKAHKTEAARVEAFANKLEALYEKHKNDPDAELGRRWYEDFIPLLRERYGDDAQIMAELLAATSPNTTPRVNFTFAERAFQRWKAGEFDSLIEAYENGMDKLADGSLEKAYNKAVPKKNRPAKVSPATLIAWWIESNDLLPRQRTRVEKGQEVNPLFGMHSKAVLKVITRRWMRENAGLKTDNFVKNLLGESEEATIDLWAARTMREAGYADFKNRWRIMPENAVGVSDVDFAFSQKVFRRAAEDLGMKPRELQGALWFIEKKRWAEKGWAELDLGDYRTELERVVREAEEASIPDPQQDLF